MQRKVALQFCLFVYFLEKCWNYNIKMDPLISQSNMELWFILLLYADKIETP